MPVSIIYSVVVLPQLSSKPTNQPPDLPSTTTSSKNLNQTSSKRKMTQSHHVGIYLAKNKTNKRHLYLSPSSSRSRRSCITPGE
ncbi:hypothetical protein BDQ94DRAFT_61934 [Aspergillus welwitschiae]|uniref:Uncharacterized protein n=1 Tax=Aspergillus welwitschiae TaxID=1341132 RepID=A0A3F3PVY6_9EURO|nr:hypothetical protein BDQ94DRAFT_61934 [Aspergillus welwitschiae]RDH31110.1 hypothetical protein BDQ94DRAFT_61934 [Aspergillus welwitschiae]